jgi:hypothetical protein
LQRDERAVAGAILGGGKGGLRGPTLDDLEALFS